MPERAILGRHSNQEPLRYLESCPIYRPTPLHDLPGLARRLGVAHVHLKDESRRLKLLSFKALGGVFAIAHILRAHCSQALGRTVAPAELLSEEVRRIAASMTFCCATDGNHGRAVAAGARLFGARSVVFLPEGVSPAREEAIGACGAQLQRTGLSYDGAVAEAQREARRHGWILVSDMALSADEPSPRLVLQGYTVLVGECLAQLGGSRLSHVFVQAGVGGLAAAVTGFLADTLGRARPVVVVVEPRTANCLQASAEKGTLVRLDRSGPTLMAMLECGQPSAPAWEILSRHADFFLSIEDEFAVDAMKLLARPVQGDPILVLGESGVAGLAGLLAVSADPNARALVGLNESSRVLLIGTEGATDPGRYEEIVGISPEELAHGVAS
jgi:diaminopropionate ammonia-lyase